MYEFHELYTCIFLELYYFYVTYALEIPLLVTYVPVTVGRLTVSHHGGKDGKK